MKKLMGDSKYSYVLRFIVLMIFILAVVVMLESFMRTICEHIRGIVPTMKNVSKVIKLAIDITVVVVTGMLLLVFGMFVEYDREQMIALSWGMCTAALAAPLMLTLMYKHSTKAGMFAGVLTGAIVFEVWNFIPFIDGVTLKQQFELSGDVVGFAASLIFSVLVSSCTKQNDESELKDFDRMLEEQQ